MSVLPTGYGAFPSGTSKHIAQWARPPVRLLFIAVTVFRLNLYMPVIKDVYHNIVLIHTMKDWVFLNPSPTKWVDKM